MNTNTSTTFYVVPDDAVNVTVTRHLNPKFWALKIEMESRASVSFFIPTEERLNQFLAAMGNPKQEGRA